MTFWFDRYRWRNTKSARRGLQLNEIGGRQQLGGGGIRAKKWKEKQDADDGAAEVDVAALDKFKVNLIYRIYLNMYLSFHRVK